MHKKKVVVVGNSWTHFDNSYMILYLCQIQIQVNNTKLLAHIYVKCNLKRKNSKFAKKINEGYNC